MRTGAQRERNAKNRLRYFRAGVVSGMLTLRQRQAIDKAIARKHALRAQRAPLRARVAKVAAVVLTMLAIR